MHKDTPARLSSTTRWLHWIVAIAIIGLLASGIYMEENDAYAVYPWHKSFGMLLLVLALARVLWRIYNSWPVPVGDYSKVEKISAKVIHYVLILATVAMPVSGVLMSGFGGHGLDVFGLELMASNPDLANPGKVLPVNQILASIGYEIHGVLGYFIIGALVLHIVGALKHHFIDKDGTLRRMLGSGL